MRWNGLTSSDLKWIAIISMLVDHFAVAIYVNMADYQFDVYRVMRGIGRIAFPIYCFLLVEGFCHTHDVKRYISRCFLFAVISEVPFDLAVHGAWVYPEGQNVFFTLAIGLCTLYAISVCERRGMSIIHLRCVFSQEQAQHSFLKRIITTWVCYALSYSIICNDLIKYNEQFSGRLW